MSQHVLFLALLLLPLLPVAGARLRHARRAVPPDLQAPPPAAAAGLADSCRSCTSATCTCGAATSACCARRRPRSQGSTPDLLCVTGDMCEKVADIHTGGRPAAAGQAAAGHVRRARQPRAQRAAARRTCATSTSAAGGRLVGALLQPRRAASAEATATKKATPWPMRCSAAGITVLHNAGVARTQATTRALWIAGCDSAWAGHADMARGHARSPPGRSLPGA